MKSSKIRPKNRLKSQVNGCALIGIISLGSQSIPPILYGSFSDNYFKNWYLAYGLIFFIPIAIYTLIILGKRRKLKRFYKYANDFEDNDEWLPKNFEIHKEDIEILTRIKSEGLERMIDEKGSDRLISEIESCIEYIHEIKRKIEIKLREWTTVPVANNKVFYDINTRMSLRGRAAIYTEADIADIRGSFISELGFCDELISRANKILKEAMEQGFQVKKNISNASDIDGLSTSDI